MTLKVAYDDHSENFFIDLKALITYKYPLIETEGFHENLLKERKKAFQLKGGFSARKSPFLVLFDVEGTPIKAFYTEANECSLDNIEKVLDSYIPYKNKDNESTSN